MAARVGQGARIPATRPRVMWYTQGQWQCFVPKIRFFAVSSVPLSNPTHRLREPTGFSRVFSVSVTGLANFQWKGVNR